MISARAWLYLLAAFAVLFAGYGFAISQFGAVGGLCAAVGALTERGARHFRDRSRMELK